MNEPLIDPDAAEDQARCRPEALHDVAGKLSRDLLPQLEALRYQVTDLPQGAAGTWDIAQGYADTVGRARQATGESVGFVAEQVQRVIDDLVATADTVRDADRRAVPRSE
ncbi:hypothetical protein HCN51_41240 [Nonomuraea sp. FMUSA5-5]|uniref:PE domain-containing protein n=1 Tax=Nonomuraea composti TaxID=2720023 RepID=A0ABX1BH35_9ACTN|nr:hypothetical protein [Nonomuraea sp. FMUSA5-5]NJP95789.1 hypothetical protein [Nonomuraea sp. FMUSA5-5]